MTEKITTSQDKLNKLFDQWDMNWQRREALVEDVACSTALVLADCASRLVRKSERRTLMWFVDLLSAISCCATDANACNSQLSYWEHYFLQNAQRSSRVAVASFCRLLIELQRRQTLTDLNATSQLYRDMLSERNENTGLNTAEFSVREFLLKQAELRVADYSLFPYVFSVDAENIGVLRPFSPSSDASEMSYTEMACLRPSEECALRYDYVELIVVNASEITKAVSAK